MITITLKDKINDKYLSYNIIPYDTPLKDDWLSALEIVLRKQLPIDNDFCHLGFKDSPRNVEFLCNRLEKCKEIINDFFKANSVDILINNTQGPPAGDVLSVSELDYENTFNLLFQNTISTSMAALKGMKKNGWGRIINMTSVSVKEPLSYLALSNTIRSAVTSWGKTLSIESGKYNITVNNILTGFFNTERLKELNSEKAKKFNIETDEVFQKMSEMVPMKRIGEPEEFGYLVAFLSSEYANYINGVNIPIDGGLLKSM